MENNRHQSIKKYTVKIFSCKNKSSVLKQNRYHSFIDARAVT